MEAILTTKDVGAPKRPRSAKQRLGKSKTNRHRPTVRSALDDRGTTIAATLMRGAVGGNSLSANLLLKMAELKTVSDPKAQRKRRPESMAKRLAAEPQWMEPIKEETAETWAGRREPEG